MATDEEDWNERTVRRETLRRLEERGFSWIEEDVRVKPPDRERAFILDAVVYVADEDGEKQPYVVVDVKKNVGTWARDQMQPYADHLDASYIYVTNGSKDYWFNAGEEDGRLPSPPSPPEPGTGARLIDGSEAVEDIHTFFRRALDARKKREGVLLTALLLKYVHDRGVLDFDPSSKASLQTSLSYGSLPEFLKQHRRKLQKHWDRIWRYLNSFAFPDSFRWSRFTGWFQQIRQSIILEEDGQSRYLLKNRERQFLSDLLAAFPGENLGLIEYNVGQIGLSRAEAGEESVNVFDDEVAVRQLIRSLLWAQELTEENEVIAVDPVASNIVEQFEEEYDNFSLIPPRRRRAESLSDDFDLAESFSDAAVYIEGALDMLKPGGRLVAVVPPVLLSGKRDQPVRDYIRERAVIEASLEMPVHAVERRENQGCLVLRKKIDSDEPQEDVFMGVVEDPEEPEEELGGLSEEILAFYREKIDGS